MPEHRSPSFSSEGGTTPCVGLLLLRSSDLIPNLLLDHPNADARLRRVGDYCSSDRFELSLSVPAFFAWHEAFPSFAYLGERVFFVTSPLHHVSLFGFLLSRVLLHRLLLHWS